MFGGKVSDLSGLGIEDGSGVVDVLVNKHLVLKVDEGAEKDDRSGEKAEAPEGEPLDEPVG